MKLEKIKKWYEDNISDFDQDQADFLEKLIEYISGIVKTNKTNEADIIYLKQSVNNYSIEHSALDKKINELEKQIGTMKISYAHDLAKLQTKLITASAKKNIIVDPTDDTPTMDEVLEGLDKMYKTDRGW